MHAVATHELTRTFGPRRAVGRLTVDVPLGGVVGLLGPNGSGKSTLIRMLLGLVRPTEGDADVLGSSIRHPAQYAERVGALVESPAFVPGLSAHANLLSLARLRGLPRSRVAEVITAVGLSGREREPVRRFSLGMKQRLGIAAALLPDPELLILDEPTNGLDPAGIVEIRALLVRLGQSGRTVIVSSHLMAEIEAACDWLIIVRFGELVFSGPIGELMARTETFVDVEAEHHDDNDTLARVLAVAGWVTELMPDGVRVRAGRDSAAEINRTAMAAGFTLGRVQVVHDSLEHVFLELTGQTDGELAQDRAAGQERTKVVR
ncbi:ABC transporter ATP-binding protein [Cellulomonas humilata]|uniref:ABC-2 type transport system ATP-binding protein n=1 Tax=Cellulomonas humilata TaxID=144055 RepID=A0ABU0EE35_9CELL|nr:ATP-binding cassette domain-containing protein [Cellulomonas humilata]MDQ0373526.1 ABC-2 type transport system ATP-binding protein [Cellulomonas humilata]